MKPSIRQTQNSGFSEQNMREGWPTHRGYAGGAIALIATAILVAAACGNDSQSQHGSPTSPGGLAGQTAPGPGSSQPMPNPCSLLTSADIQQTLGMPVGEVDGPKPPDSDPDGLLCHWTEPQHHGDEMGKPYDYVTLSIYSRRDYCDQFNQALEEAGMEGGSPISGLGGTAIWDDPGTNQSICIDIGDTSFKLWSFIEPPVGQASMEALAKIVLSRF